MKRCAITKRIAAILVAFAVTFTMIPAASGGLNSSAATPYWKNLKATVGDGGVWVSWKKLTKTQRKKITGIVIYRNGKKVKVLKKNTNQFFDDKGRKGNVYQLKTYKKTTKTVTKYWNKKTKKWQLKKIKGVKTKKVKKATYKYGNASPKKKAAVKKTTSSSGSDDNKDSGGTDDTSVTGDSSQADTAFAKCSMSNMTLDLADSRTYQMGGYGNFTGPYYDISLSSKKTITWSSSNTSVATVTGYFDGSDGLIHLKATGKTTITATNWDGQKKTAVITVIDSRNSGSSSGDSSSSGGSSGTSGSGSTTDSDFAGSVLSNVTIDVMDSNSYSVGGKSFTGPYHAYYLASQKTISWTSSNTSVATVQGYSNGQHGLVLAKATGKTTITATNWDGQKKTATVTVTDSSIISLTGKTKSCTAYNGNTRTFYETDYAYNGRNKWVEDPSDLSYGTVVSSGRYESGVDEIISKPRYNHLVDGEFGISGGVSVIQKNGVGICLGNTPETEDGSSAMVARLFYGDTSRLTLTVQNETVPVSTHNYDGNEIHLTYAMSGKYRLAEIQGIYERKFQTGYGTGYAKSVRIGDVHCGFVSGTVDIKVSYDYNGNGKHESDECVGTMQYTVKVDPSRAAALAIAEAATAGVSGYDAEMRAIKQYLLANYKVTDTFGENVPMSCVGGAYIIETWSIEKYGIYGYFGYGSQPPGSANYGSHVAFYPENSNIPGREYYEAIGASN